MASMWSGDFKTVFKTQETLGTGEGRRSKNAFDWKWKSLKQDSNEYRCRSEVSSLFTMWLCQHQGQFQFSASMKRGRFSIEALKKNKLRKPDKVFRTFLNIVNWADTLLIYHHQHFRSFWSKLQQNRDIQYTNVTWNNSDNSQKICFIFL